jgi:cytochrome b6-f complex iron-sulfur subunit
MNRRDFLNWVGVGCVASSLPMAIAACSNTATQTTNPSTAGNNVPIATRPDGFFEVGTVKDLEQQGRILLRRDSDNSVLVVQNSATPNAIVAINPICTHQRCLVDWNADNKRIFCPCHGSTFNPDGTPIQGPAPKPLQRYEAKVEGSTVLVKIS